MSDVARFSSKILRSLIPVRLIIHSSDVSQNCSKSVFDLLFGGIYPPIPVIAAYGLLGILSVIN